MASSGPTPGTPAELDALVALARRAQSAGRLDEAAGAYRKIVALRPDFAEAYNNLGNVLADQGQLDEAAASYQQALALRPGYADAHYNLGNVLVGQGQLDEAVASYRQAITLQPGHAAAHYNLGNVLFGQGQLAAAATHYQQTLALQPNNAEAQNNLGIIFSEQGRLDEAVTRYRHALALRPDYAGAHNNLGNTLKQQDNFDQALAHYEQALALQPNFPDAHNNLGNVLLIQGKLDAAETRYRQALALRPSYAEAHNNLGIICRERGKFDEAVARYQQALTLRPDYADASLGLAACYLVDGDFERGWPAYEGRLRIAGGAPRHNLPRWTGQSLAGRSLLLVAEQGLGDTIQFIRYARVLKERGARVVLAAPAALGRLLAVHCDADELFILNSAQGWPRCDYYLPLLSAPLALGTTAATIPSGVPYLAADPELTESWRRELSGIAGFKVGIVWQGSQDFSSDRWRSIPLAHFAPLARLPGVRLVSLQKGSGAEQIATVDFPLIDLAGRLDEAAGAFMDTAAVIRNLDLVVTADTAIAHLAGALGARVWVALQYSPNWRWLLGRDDSPWYPTVRLFRQTAFDEWPEVLERIANAVQAHRSEVA